MLRQWRVQNLRGFWHSPCNLGTLLPHPKTLHTSPLDRGGRELGYERAERPSYNLEADSTALLEWNNESDTSNSTDLPQPPDLSFLYQDKPEKETYTWSARSNFSESVDVQRENSDSEVQIRSIGFVPNFKKALLGHSRGQIYRRVKTKDYAKQLQKDLWAKSSNELRQFHIRRPYALNALLARFHMVGCRPDPRAYLHGIQISAGYPLAMKMYLHKLVADGAHMRAHAKRVPDAAARVFAVIACELKGPWINDRKKAQFLEILTGWIGQDWIGDQNKRRPPSLWYLMDKLSSEQWDAYLDLVYQTGGHLAIVREYEAFQAFRSRFIDDPPAWARKRLSGHVRGQPYSILNGVIPSAFIRALATDGSWQMAWKIAYEVGEGYRISKATWVKLLAYPDGAREWTLDMKQAAMTMLDAEMKKMEETLGVKWKGGEEGYHVTVESSKFHPHEWPPRLFQWRTEKDFLDNRTKGPSVSDFEAGRERLEEEREALIYVDEDE